MTPAPRMNMMPPMVGVPALDLCHVGPSSRISWPAFRLRSSGMRNLPMSSVSTKLTAAAIKESVIYPSPSPSPGTAPALWYVPDSSGSPAADPPPDVPPYPIVHAAPPTADRRISRGPPEVNPADFKGLPAANRLTPDARRSLPRQVLRHDLPFVHVVLLVVHAPQNLRFCGDPAFDSNRPK